MDPVIDRWAWLSPYHALGVMQAWIFGIETRPQAVVPSLVSLALVSLVAVIVLLNRIDAPTRALTAQGWNPRRSPPPHSRLT